MVTIQDSSQATLAAQWCKRNGIKYDIDFLGWPGNTRYRFKFNNEKDLVIFSLKWIEYGK